MYRTDNALAVAAYLLGSDREVFLRELVEMLDIEHETVRRITAAMEKAGYLSSTFQPGPLGVRRLGYSVSNQRSLEIFFNGE